MPLNERVKKPTSTYPRTPCSIGVLLTDLPAPEAKALKRMLDAPWRVWTHKGIERALKAEGYEFGNQQVGKHRREDCSCAPRAAA